MNISIKHQNKFVKGLLKLLKDNKGKIESIESTFLNKYKDPRKLTWIGEGGEEDHYEKTEYTKIEIYIKHPLKK